MKNHVRVVGLLCLIISPLCARTNPKEKDMEHIAMLLSNALHSHAGQMEKSIANIGEMVASQIQNFMLDLTLNNQNDKDCCHKILERLENAELLLAVIIQQLALQKQVIGNVDDPSVDPNDFKSVADIDNAQLSLVSWAKTIFRQLWDQGHIS
jgi:hypothetical protein